MFRFNISFLVLISFLNVGCTKSIYQNTLVRVTLEGTGFPSGQEVNPQIKKLSFSRAKASSTFLP